MNESYRLTAAEKLEDIAVVSVPHMDKNNSSTIIASYQRAASDIIELTTPVDDYSGLDRLKKILNNTNG